MTMDVNPIRQRFQVAQNEVLPNGYPRFLFRGQSKGYNSLNTTIGRLYATDSNAVFDK